MRSERGEGRQSCGSRRLLELLKHHKSPANTPPPRFTRAAPFQTLTINPDAERAHKGADPAGRRRGPCAVVAEQSGGSPSPAAAPPPPRRQLRQPLPKCFPGARGLRRPPQRPLRPHRAPAQSLPDSRGSGGAAEAAAPSPARRPSPGPPRTPSGDGGAAQPRLRGRGRRGARCLHGGLPSGHPPAVAAGPAAQ